MNIFAANIFQIHHGRCQVFVPEPFLKFANTANIVLQVDRGEGVPKLVKEPVTKKRPIPAAVAMPGGTRAAVETSAIRNLLEFAFKIWIQLE